MNFLSNQHPPVKIYTTPECVYCQMAKRFFEKKSLPYIEYDISRDLNLRQAVFDSVGLIGVPVIEVGNEIFVGFDREGIENALRLS